MIVEESVTINGCIVEFHSKVRELVFYTSGSDDDFLYITRNKEVIGTISINANCSQNTGYVESVVISEIKGNK